MKELTLKKNSRKPVRTLALVIALTSICLSGCNGGLASGRLVRINKTKVIVPEEIPADQLEVPPCEEVDEIKWGDARNASDHYRRCSDLRGERLKSLISTIKGRWKWILEESEKVEEDNAAIEKEADKLFKD